MIPNRLFTLGHPRRLDLFRLLMRRYPDRVPATELAQALGLKPSTLSTYVNALMQAGLVSQERSGTSLRYRIDMDAARETISYLLHDCCRGRPEICAPDAMSGTIADRPIADRPARVLFICTGNSARSILAESILNDIAPQRFDAHSAGTKPRSGPHPLAVEVLRQRGHTTSPLRSKNISEFQAGEAPDFDFVVTVCNRAANEDCPAWRGHPVSIHWSLANPIRDDRTDAENSHALHQTYDILRRRLSRFADLPLSGLDRLSLQRALDDIGQSHPEGHPS